MISKTILSFFLCALVAINVTYHAKARPTGDSVVEFCQANTNATLTVAPALALLPLPVVRTVIPHAVAVVSGPIDSTVGFMGSGIASPDRSRQILYKGDATQVTCQKMLEQTTRKPYNILRNNCFHFVGSLGLMNWF